MDFPINDCDAHMVALADKRLRGGRAAHAGALGIFVGRGIVNLVPLHRADVAAAEQINLPSSSIAEMAPRGRDSPAIGVHWSVAVS